MYRPGVVPATGFLQEPAPVIAYKKQKPNAVQFEQVAYFCDTTANHGFAHLVDNNEIFWLRIVWAIVIATFAGFVIMFVYMSVDNLISKTLTSEFLELEFDKENGVFLPDIHICDSTIFNATRLKEMGFDNTTATYLTLATSDNSFNPNFEDNTNGTLLKEEFDRILANGAWTLEDVINKASIKCMDIVWHCSTAGILYNAAECCNLFFSPSPYVSIFGSCISTRGKSIRQLYPSRDAGFVVYIMPNQNVINFDLDLIKAEYILQKGLYYAVSSAAVNIASVLHTTGRFAAPKTWVSVPIIKSVLDNSELKGNALAPHTCIDSDDEVFRKLRTPNYDYYSETNCMMSHYQNVYQRYGNCSAIFYEQGIDDKLCGPHFVLNFNISLFMNLEKCPIECITETYELSPSYAHFNTEFLHKRYNINIIDNDPVVLHFFYSSFKYRMRISHTNTFLKWLGEVGGNLGLFLGASLISILEILAVFLRCCIKSSSR